MEDRTNTGNQSGQGQGGDEQSGREGQDGARQVGTEDRSAGGNESSETLGAMMGVAESDYAFNGGRQETDESPNPDDANGKASAGSYRGTAEVDSGDGDADAEKGLGAGQVPGEDLNSQTRNPV